MVIKSLNSCEPSEVPVSFAELEEVFDVADGDGALELLDTAVNTSNMDAGTYNPETAQDTVVDAGLYINV